MKFSVALILCSLSTSSLVSINAYENIHYYESLITNIYTKYRTAGILIGSTAPTRSFEALTAWYGITRTLSHQGISSVVVHFQQFTERLKFYARNPNRPLVVILLDKMKDIHMFAEITQNLDMSYAVWLILFTGGTDQDACKLCRNPQWNLLNLKFNSEVLTLCCNSYIIEEWWSSGRNRTNARQLGRWINENSEIKWFSNESLYSRRSSLEGRPFRIAIAEDAFIWERDDELHGILSPILQELSQSMNFTIETVKEDVHGFFDPDTSRWSGVIGRLQRGEADVGVAGFSITRQRRTIIDFTIPVIVADIRLWIKKPDAAAIQWNAYFKAFSIDVWIALIAFILTMPLFFTLIKYNRRRFHFLPLVIEHYLDVWGIYCLGGLPGFPNGISLRILYASISMSALVVSCAYSASLISFLAVTHLPFNDMEQFIKDGTYELIVIQNSGIYDLLQYSEYSFVCLNSNAFMASQISSTEPIMRQLMSVMKPKYLLPKDQREAFQQICAERVAYYSLFTKLKASSADVMPCEPVSIKTGVDELSGIILPLGSQYTALFNYHIHRLKRNGVLGRIKEQHASKDDLPEPAHSPPRLQGIAPLLGIIIGGLIIASIILLIEHIFRFFNNKLRDRQIKKCNKKNVKHVHFSRQAVFRCT